MRCFFCLVSLVSRQILLDDCSALLAHLDDVVAPSVLDGLMEGQGDSAWGDVESAARHHLVTAIDGDGHHG